LGYERLYRQGAPRAKSPGALPVVAEKHSGKDLRGGLFKIRGRRCIVETPISIKREEGASHQERLPQRRGVGKSLWGGRVTDLFGEETHSKRPQDPEKGTGKVGGAISTREGLGRLREEGTNG